MDLIIEISTRALTLEIIADTCGAEIAKVATFLVSVYNQHRHSLLFLITFLLVWALICERECVHVHTFVLLL
jgi:hypothetical protein